VNDQIILADINARQLKTALRGRSFENTRRHGKYLFVTLDDGVSLVMHFGMTGELKYYKVEANKPEYTQMLFAFENDYHLAYVLPRKLGEIRLEQEYDAFIKRKELGPDVLKAGFDFAAFQEALSGRRAMIKSALMNQKIMAGVGNVYSDEILFQAQVHPRRKVSELEEYRLEQVFNCMKSVLETAIKYDADTEQLPQTFLLPHRKEGEACPRCDGEIEKIRVAGRSGYYCPSCQSN
jgi:formamidopyrimidine-DNA glycosylase